MVQINLTQDEDKTSEGNPLNFLGIMEADKGCMATSFNNTSINDNILKNENEVKLPPKIIAYSSVQFIVAYTYTMIS
jgi:hypothetical protein